MFAMNTPSRELIFSKSTSVLPLYTSDRLREKYLPEPSLTYMSPSGPAPPCAYTCRKTVSSLVSITVKLLEVSASVGRRVLWKLRNPCKTVDT